MLEMRPCIPAGWPGFTIAYRHGQALYTIQVERAARAGDGSHVTLDGSPLSGGGVRLVDDGREHTVVVRLSGPEGD
jgi:cyclic beta-1,2-glucan glucanotransferase